MITSLSLYNRDLSAFGGGWSEFFKMSLNHKKELSEIAKIICRDLRKKSTEAEKI
jgi:hypothetical protein